MPRCQYCRCQLPGFETLCQKCFEGRSYQLFHPAPWWHFRWYLPPRWQWRRPRFKRVSVYLFLFWFALGFFDFRFGFFHPMAMKRALLIAFVLAALGALLGSSIEERKSDFK
jgi:hypothetical protein